MDDKNLEKILDDLENEVLNIEDERKARDLNYMLKILELTETNEEFKALLMKILRLCESRSLVTKLEKVI